MPNINYSNQTLGRGELRFSKFTTPTSYIPAGFEYLGNTTEFSMTVQAQMLDHYSMDHGIQEKDKSIPTRVDRTGKFTADSISITNLGRFFFGDALTVTQTSSTAVSETLPPVIPGFSYQLGITANRPAGVKGVANVAITSKTAGVDFVFDAARGIITILAGGTIAAGATPTVTYDIVANSYDQIISGNVPVVGALMFVADNPEGANVDYLMRYVRLVPNGDFSLKAENAWQQLPFTVEILRAPGMAAIYANGQP